MVSLVEAVLVPGKGKCICKKEIKDMVNICIGWIINSRNLLEKYFDFLNNNEVKKILNQYESKSLDTIVNFTPFKLPYDNDGISGSLAILITLVNV